jgi:hypothetical protein
MKGSTVVILIILVIFGIACLQPVLADEQGADNVTASGDVVAGSGETTYSAEALVLATTATTAPTPTPYVPTGSFQISSSPSGASVWVDGVVQAGMTPITVTGLTQGNHWVELEKTGYEHWETQAYAQVGATTNIFANLVPGTSTTTVPTTAATTAQTTGATTAPTPATGNLQVVSNPSAARIYIDGSYRGITPAIISDLSTNWHTVVLNKSGYQTWTEQVYVWGGQTNNVLAVLVPGDDSDVTPTTTATATLSPTATTTTSPTNGYANSATFGIYSTPANATVYIDSVFRGYTPIVVTGLTQGLHAVKIQKTGYKTYNSNVYGQIGATTTIFTALIPGTDPTPSGGATTVTTIPTPSSPPHYGTLSVISWPINAAVYVDGISKGNTPVSLAGTLIGNHTVTVEKSGYKTWQTVATVTEGTITRVSAVLVANTTTSTSPTPTKTVVPTFPTPTKSPTATPTPVPSGNLMVMSNPGGASIYLDNVFKGDTPLIISSIPAGNHTVKVAMTGYEDWTSTVTIQKGTLTRVVANLVPEFL